MLIKKVGNTIRIILTKCPSKKELLELVKALKNTDGEFYEIINKDLYIPFDGRDKVINFLLNIASNKLSITYLCPLTFPKNKLPNNPILYNQNGNQKSNVSNTDSLTIILGMVLTFILFLPSWGKPIKNK